MSDTNPFDTLASWFASFVDDTAGIPFQIFDDITPND